MKNINFVKDKNEKHLGRKVKIDSYEEFKGPYGLSLRVKTEPLELAKKSDGTEFPIIASKFFPLTKDSNGSVYVSPSSKLGQFCAKYGLGSPNELIGLEVTITREKEKFLTFE